jgi:hypothetical protein
MPLSLGARRGVRGCHPVRDWSMVHLLIVTRHCRAGLSHAALRAVASVSPPSPPSPCRRLRLHMESRSPTLAAGGSGKSWIRSGQRWGTRDYAAWIEERINGVDVQGCLGVLRFGRRSTLWHRQLHVGGVLAQDDSSMKHRYAFAAAALVVTRATSASQVSSSGISRGSMIAAATNAS